MVSGFHHVGCLVSSISDAIEDYKILYPDGTVTDTWYIENQDVNVCFFTIGNTHIEFLEPQSTKSPLYKLLLKSLGFYHIAVFTTDINAEIERLESKGYKAVNLFQSPAFEGRYCAFLYNNEMHLIELIEEAK